MTEPVDIIIPVRTTNEFQNGPLLERCVDTLCQTTKNFRLIFVDDHSDPEGAEQLDRLAKRFPNSILVRTQFQRWWTRAVNLGLRMARTERVAILNSDIILGEGWLEELREVWAEVERVTGKRVGLVGSVYSAEELRRWIPSVGQDYVTGHCLLVHMSALSEISAARGMPGIYIDETQASHIHIHSDVVTCWEMNKLGWQTIKSFKSRVGHEAGKSWGHRLYDIAGLTLEKVSERWV